LLVEATIQLLSAFPSGRAHRNPKPPTILRPPP
jgi:hypothetical protein